MEDQKLKKGIKHIKEIIMTNVEKQHVLDNIYGFRYKKEELVKSPWSVYVFVSLIKRNRLVYYVVIPLIIILSGGGVVFASQESLPNHILYPIKVKVLEPVEGALIFSQKEKAKYQSKLATTRLIEAQVLAKEKKLDVSTEEKINKLLVSHTTAFDNTINKVSQNNFKNEVDEITTNFRAEMNANAKILDNLNKNEEIIEEEKEENGMEIIKEEKEEVTKKEDEEIIEEVKEEKNEISITEKKENDDTKYNSLSKTARESAISIKDTLKDQKIENKDNYKDKKEKLKLFIDNVDKDINRKEIEKLIINKKFIDDTRSKIEEAKKYLEEADKKEIEGDEKSARSFVLDSESLLKEIEILIKSEVDLKNEYKKEIKNKD